jgi:hypothetical protein
MDNNTIFSVIALSISIGSIIIGIINHKRLSSRCNKRQLSVSIDIDNTSGLTENLLKT